MTISANVSLLAQSTSQSNRLNDLRSTLDDLQRQSTTQKKYDTYAGFGTDALNLQRLHSSQPLLQSYMDNIDTVSNTMTLMNTSLSQISDVGNQLVQAIQLQLQGGQANMQTIRAQAQQGLSFVEDLMNQNINGHYIFAGSDVTNQPFVDNSTLNSNFQNQLTGWLAGTVSNAQLISTTDSFNASNLGLSAGLAAAGPITARIDQNLDVDYTIKADQPGFQDILRALTFAANLPYPDPSTDVATPTQFNDILNHVLDLTTNGVKEIDDTTQQLASKFNLIKSIRDTHASDMDLEQTQMDKIENADPTSALVSMQALQTQLTASYQVTSMISQMSLTNFL